MTPPRPSLVSLRPVAVVLVALLTLLPGCTVPANEVVEGHPLTVKVQKAVQSGKQRFDHADFDAVLKKHVSAQSRVDYSGLRNDPSQLNSYLQKLAQAPVAELSRDEVMALLINAYNAYTLQLIVTQNPKASIKDISKPWDQEFCNVGGETVSLNFLEHKLLRVAEIFGREPRVHFAVNCASIGCPPLLREAFRGDRLEAQLEGVTRSCLAQPEYLAARDGKVYVSKILNWFKGDFTGKHKTLTAFLLPYASPEIQEILKEKGDSAIAFFDYDWKLNGK